jgi:hypothetical protein
MAANEGVPKGDVFEFTMKFKDSKIYRGIAREPNTFAVANTADPTRLSSTGILLPIRAGWRCTFPNHTYLGPEAQRQHDRGHHAVNVQLHVAISISGGIATIGINSASATIYATK